MKYRLEEYSFIYPDKTYTQEEIMNNFEHIEEQYLFCGSCRESVSNTDHCCKDKNEKPKSVKETEELEEIDKLSFNDANMYTNQELVDVINQLVDSVNAHTKALKELQK